MRQLLLFPDPRPLVERLGREFFRQVPERPGVYVMHDKADRVLYVGKAKNLRQRLRSYRVANPDRMPRRHLRLLRAVVRIQLEECVDEAAALAREAALLRSIRPRFNRAGTWPAPRRFLARQSSGERLALAIFDAPRDGWENSTGGSGLTWARASLVRLLWLALNPATGVAGMHAGWFHGKFQTEVKIECGSRIHEVSAAVGEFFGGEPGFFDTWVRRETCGISHPFEQQILAADLELVNGFSRRLRGSGWGTNNSA